LGKNKYASKSSESQEKRRRITAEAVEKDNLHDHFIPDFLLHQSIKKYA
jgi:hypothetical protein